MIDYKKFIHLEVIDKNNNEGKIIHLDEKHVVVKYLENSVTYSTQVVFSKAFLTFKEKRFNFLFQLDQSNKEEEEKKIESTTKERREKLLAKRKLVNQIYKRLREKEAVMRYLFGRDFLYPPRKNFEEKYKDYIDRSYKFKNIDSSLLPNYISVPWYFF